MFDRIVEPDHTRNNHQIDTLARQITVARQAILDYDWSNHNLDELFLADGRIDPEHATDLAVAVVTAIANTQAS